MFCQIDLLEGFNIFWTGIDYDKLCYGHWFLLF
jgi:hypothetical protein